MITYRRLSWLAGVAVGVGLGLAGAQGVAQADVESASADPGPQAPSRSSDAAGVANTAPSRVSTTSGATRATGGVEAARGDDDTSSTATASRNRRAARAEAAAQVAPAVTDTVVTLSSSASRTASARTVAVLPPAIAVPSDRPSADALTEIPDPSPGDEVPTPYGDIGKWSLNSQAQISDWLGQKYWDRTLFEPVNLIVVDRTSTTPQESAQLLNRELGAAGFPARTVHSTGYRGLIDGVIYDQEPTGAEEAYSNDFYLLPNDHARFFGPAPASDGTGFVWTATVSREEVGLYNFGFTHTYVSFARARNTLRDNLIEIGAADLGWTFLNNAVRNATQTTGDHNGFAAVVELRPTGVRLT